MLLAASSYSYPLLGAFWTILMIFLWVIWFWIPITVFIDIFRSRDLVRLGQDAVVCVRAVLPVDRCPGLPDRPRWVHARAGGAAGAGSGGAVPRLRPGGRGFAESGGSAGQAGWILRDRGVITADEFDREKAKILAWSRIVTQRPSEVPVLPRSSPRQRRSGTIGTVTVTAEIEHGPGRPRSERDAAFLKRFDAAMRLPIIVSAILPPSSSLQSPARLIGIGVGVAHLAGVPGRPPCATARRATSGAPAWSF